MAKEDIVKYQFKEGNTASVGFGRPKKLLSGIMADLREAGYERITKAMVQEAYEVLLGMDNAALKAFKDNKDYPAIVGIVAKALLMNKDPFQVLETMMDRAHGKPKQTQEIEAEHKIVNDMRELSNEQLLAIIQRGEGGGGNG